MLPVRVSRRNSSRFAGTQMPGGDWRQSGSSASSGPGSITAPESECAPTAEPFSSTQTLRSGLSCLRRMAHARPAGPAPTIATSYSITSRSMVASAHRSLLRLPCGWRRRAGWSRRSASGSRRSRPRAARIPRACRGATETAPACRATACSSGDIASIIGVWKMPGAIGHAANAEHAPARARSAASCP